MFGPSYCYDNPASMLNGVLSPSPHPYLSTRSRRCYFLLLQLKRQFDVPIVVTNFTTPSEKRLIERFNENYGLLYSLFSLPNTVM